MIEQIRTDFSTVYPPDIVDALIDSFIEIRENYYLGKYEPSELNGGKFVEACVRLLQHELRGNVTPIGQSIRDVVGELRDFERVSTTYHDSLRLHIPRVLLGIYNIRNRRGVGHLGGDVNPNRADSSIIVSTASWVLAELYRIHYATSLDEAQLVVDELVERKLALVHDVGDVKRVLNHKLTARDQTIILLYTAHPGHLSDDELLMHIEYANRSYYKRKILKDLHKKRLLNYSHEGKCLILPPGLRYVEDNYNIWLNSLNYGG